MLEVTLQCRDLVKSFGGVRAVDDVDLAFESGRVTALIGPNGAGKTTLFHLITGMLRPDAGEVLCHNQSLVGLKPWEVARLGVGRLFQDVRIFGRLSVLDNALAGFRRGEGPLTALLARGKMWRQEAEHEEQALRWLELVNLAEHRFRAAEELSWGQQKLLALVRLLAVGTEVLLLDEPTAGVNPSLIDHLLDVIRNVAQQGKTVVVIEHNMNVVLDIAQWAYFMDNGQVTAFGLPEEVLGNKSVRARYLGL